MREKESRERKAADELKKADMEKAKAKAEKAA